MTPGALPLLRAAALAAAIAVAHAPQAAAEPPVLSEADLEHFRLSLAAGDMTKWRSALTHAGRAGHPLPLKIATWRWLSAKDGIGKWEDIRDFHRANPGWPRPERLLLRAERRMPDDLPAGEARAWFSEHPPVSGIGRVRHAEALRGILPDERVAEMVRAAWIEADLLPSEERSVLLGHKQALGPEAHALRLDRLIWDREWGAARRQLRRVPSDIRRLGDARIRLGRREGGVDAAVDRVPRHLLSDPGLVFERARWRRRAGLDTALELLDPPPPELGPRPERWWGEVRFHVRRMLSDKRFEDAYRLAANHGQPPGSVSALAEAEWIAGWTALRFLDDAEGAYRHFQRMHGAVSMPISVARASYWAGLAAETADAERSEAWHREAAELSATFYGQLAAHRLGETPDPPPTEASVPARTRERWRGTEMAEAVRALAQAGHRNLLRTFVLHIADGLRDKQELALLHELCREAGHPHLALAGARVATRGGLYLPGLTFPSDAGNPAFVNAEGSVERALLLALIRQESAFDASARSRANALGLMQLLPSTAREVARKAGSGYQRHRLTSDPAFNVFLGSRYMAGLLERFEGSYPLAIAAYNAGPGNVQRWLRLHGDPRTGEIHMLDWAELIPFHEARNYVQRVLEGLTVYRWKLTDDRVGRWSAVAADLPCPLGSPDSCPK